MTRIVWLGDSVTFGFRLESWEQAYPYRVELALERRTGRRIETVNAAVDGYSSWQQHLWLARDGLRYQPDLVVIGFVLNDVTEKFALRRFGGSGDGFQLSQTAGWVDRVAGGSALLHYARRLGALIRFGPDTQRGAARREALDVEALARHPEREDVRRAWDVTLEEIQQIVELCDARGVRLAIVVFPFAFQLADPAGLSAPQEVLARYAAARRVASLDLLQPLSRRVQDDGALLEEYFLDEDHLTRLGNQVVAELVAEFLLREKLL